jgi:site-specific DNA-methyltransferase (adenine-specific)
MIETNYNPDVLSCLANLSNDEVFTPPHIANQILDLLPNDIWSNKEAKFLDPVSKSGVFLREIAKRLMVGLEKQIPDKQTRINHIYKSQLYGIAITELTSLLSRRSVYCTKTANGKYSVFDGFDNEQGNIIYKSIPHTWKNGKCEFCGASSNQEIYNREDALEKYAYPFIHLDITKTIFKNMKFDVIVGNPPYQLNDGGGTGSSAMPIYQKFIQQAKKLDPRYLTMIIPSRWFSGGRGLDEFRDEMLKDDRIREIHDFLNASDCFPGVEIKGGVCYFLWNRDDKGLCKIFTHDGNKNVSISERGLLEKNTDTFVRYNEAISILRKVQSFNEDSFANIISANDPFGFDIRENNSYKRVKPSFKKVEFENAVEFYYNGWKKEGLGYIKKDSIQKNISWIKDYKILIPKAWGVGIMDKDWLNPFIIGNNSCCTETYLIIGPFVDDKKAQRVIDYTQTKFFHFLVSLIKNTQNAMKKVYQFVPMQNFNEKWTDEKLFKKYNLTTEEINFIESMIRPMDITQNSEVDE